DAHPLGGLEPEPRARVDRQLLRGTHDPEPSRDADPAAPEPGAAGRAATRPATEPGAGGVPPSGYGRSRKPSSIPPPSRRVAQIRPPIASTSWRHTNSPIPAPDARRWAALVRWNGSNSRSGSAAA